jgi:hypothetical protein
MNPDRLARLEPREPDEKRQSRADRERQAVERSGVAKNLAQGRSHGRNYLGRP